MAIDVILKKGTFNAIHLIFFGGVNGVTLVTS